MIKIRIAHIADIHQGLGYPCPSPLSRFDDINRVLDWTADRIIEEQCQLCLIAGDCFKDAKVMLDRASQEIASIVRFLRRLEDAEIITLVISGTPSHDAVSAYELMKQMMNTPYVNIYTSPGIYSMLGTSIACLPGLNRSALMTQDEYKGLPPEQVHRIMTDKITQMCIGMAAQMPDDKPKILMSHMTYQGAETGFTDLLMQQEPLLTREAVSGFDLVCLGHIHRPQIIDNKVFYSGPVERLSFNEEDVKPGFWIHETDNSRPPVVQVCKPPVGSADYHDIYSASYNWQHRFIETPARRYQTLTFDEGSIEGFAKHGIHYFGSSIADDIKDAIVRLKYSCSEEVAKQLNRKSLEKALYDTGAFYVSEIKADVQRVDRARDSSVNESLGPVDAIAKWAENQGIEQDEMKVLCSMTANLLESGV